MPSKKTTKKSLPTPPMPVDAGDSQDGSKIFIDIGLSKDGKPKSVEIVDSDVIVESVELIPRGFPMRIAGAEATMGIIIDDAELFERYAIEQWGQVSVEDGSFLFDSYLFPEYAFQVKHVVPGPGKIGNTTKVVVHHPPQQISDKISPVKMEDVIGQEDAKRKCRVILKYLEDPALFGPEWAPRNVLFHGPPGTGKTLMARAMASEAQANFIPRNASMLIGVHVGDGAKKIHDLYEMAGGMAPVIVFIDELDAIGLSRSFQHVRGDVIEVSTALLAELDGMEANKGVVTICATNQVSLLDPALRSRFEEEIEFMSPTAEDRKAMLDLYIGKTALKSKVDTHLVASKIDGWTGRDIKERLVKNMLHDAILTGKKLLTTEDAIALLARLQKKKQQNFNPMTV
nr:AAA family ATPase [Candidatus Sigynarchaeota archaeon]